MLRGKLEQQNDHSFVKTIGSVQSAMQHVLENGTISHPRQFFIVAITAQFSFLATV